jgi:hypothetical protein
LHHQATTTLALIDTGKTGSFTYDSAIGFDTCVVLHAVNSALMKRKLAVKGTVHKIKTLCKLTA